MNLENELLENQVLETQLLANFQVEELEKRYEFYWIDRVVIGVSPSGYTTGG